MVSTSTYKNLKLTFPGVFYLKSYITIIALTYLLLFISFYFVLSFFTF
nr:MAG TPA: hypothetical protein [Caudoviricetes sp.]